MENLVVHKVISNCIEEESNKSAYIPHIIKYMGSKKPIINFINEAISDIHIDGKWVCDLFSGSCSISASLRKRYNFISNDIQKYSETLASTYFSDLSSFSYKVLNDQIDASVIIHVQWFKKEYPNLFFDYSAIKDVKTYQKIELVQRDIFEKGKFNVDFHLFTKYYSGTYWSFEQCVWIDALRKTAENFKDTPVYNAIMSSIMYAMSYTTQSTGHFAQYRDGNTEEAMLNIIIYREKRVYDLFRKKFKELLGCLDNSLMKLKTANLSFEECLMKVPEGTTVYADPPYAPVHYSRFYHALETLVKYDYPKIDFKGRYRVDRHQSAFSQKGNALAAFEKLFEAIIRKKCQLLLSYSGSGVVKIDEIINLAKKKFQQKDYEVSVRTLDHKHSTMGRFEDADRDVVEYLIIIKLN
jgi:adenine-specific DNA-methyltransferase